MGQLLESIFVSFDFKHIFAQKFHVADENKILWIISCTFITDKLPSIKSSVKSCNLYISHIFSNWFLVKFFINSLRWKWNFTFYFMYTLLKLKMTNRCRLGTRVKKTLPYGTIEWHSDLEMRTALSCNKWSYPEEYLRILF